MASIWQVIIIPFMGTSLGAACVYFFKDNIGARLRSAFAGFAAGVMVAASFFSLIIPSLDMSSDMGKLKFIPAVIGFGLGMFFILFLDLVVPHAHVDSSEEGIKSGLKRTTKLIFAVTLHNLPEGMAVGIICIGWLHGNEKISFMGALALAIGIAIQNFPEGAIVSMPLLSEGLPKWKTFLYGTLSGIVEPIGALLMVAASGIFLPIMPYLLSFAAGAMIYVVVEELIPEIIETTHSNTGTICFATGFMLMMALDVGLG